MPYPQYTQFFIPGAIDSNVYLSGQGMKYGSWISSGGRSVGYSTSDFIEQPAYAIEAILREFCGWTSAQIDTASFDIVGNATNGKRNGWKIAFRQVDRVKAFDLIQQICFQFHLGFSPQAANGTCKLYALDADPSTPYTITQSQIGKKKPETSFIDIGSICNQFVFKYNKDYFTNDLRNTITIDETQYKTDDYANMMGDGTHELVASVITNWETNDFSHGFSGGVFELNTTTPINGLKDFHWKSPTTKTGYANVHSISSFPFVKNYTYRIRFTYRKVGATIVKYKLGKTTLTTATNLGGTSDVTLSATSNTVYELYFTPTETSRAHVIFYDENNTNRGEMYIDDFSIQMVPPSNNPFPLEHGFNEFDPTSFTPDMTSSVVLYGGDATKSLCGASQTYWKVTEFREYELDLIRDTSTAIRSAKKFVTWKTMIKQRVVIVGWWGDTGSSSEKPLILYERGDQCYIDHPLLDPSVSNSSLFIVERKRILKRERKVQLHLLQIYV